MLLRSLFSAQRPRTPLPTLFVRSVASGSNGHNQAIIDMLNQHMEAEERSKERNGYKVRAFANAIKVINRLDHTIRSVDDVRNVRGFGPGIVRRLEDFLMGAPEATNADKELEKQRTKTKSDLQTVHGIGSTKARQLVEAGCTKISDLEQPQYFEMLTSAMKIGFQYHSHIKEPVQRHESELATQFIRDHISPKFEIMLLGSYRRGAPTSSDIDIALFHPAHVQIPTPPRDGLRITPGRKTDPLRPRRLDGKARRASLLIQEVILPLKDRGLIAATLSEGEAKWQGVVRLPEREQSSWNKTNDRLLGIKEGRGVFRRMDISMVPLRSKGAAMLSLTGDIEFNRDVRLRAVKLGMHLNEYGLWRWRNADGSLLDESKEESDSNKPDGSWELVRAETEEEILEEIGMEYIEPEKRNFAFLTLPQGRPKKRV